MRNRTIALTFAVVLALVSLTIWRDYGWRRPSWMEWATRQFNRKAQTPEDAVYSMIDAERAGDTRAYMAVFSGTMHQELAQLVRESNESQFSSYLIRSARFEGVAVAITDRPSPDEAQARVDYVFRDRNEVQNLSLKKENDQWKVLKVDGAEQVRSLFPFGSSVTD